MKLIIGLGNPGSKYNGSRHNVGFDVVDRLASIVASGEPARSKFDSVIVETQHKGEKILFMKNECEREYVFFQYVLENLFMNYDKDTLICYKQNKVSDKKMKDFFHEVGNIYKDIINSLHPMTYKIIVETSQKIFTRIKGILN